MAGSACRRFRTSGTTRAVAGATLRDGWAGLCWADAAAVGPVRVAAHELMVQCQIAVSYPLRSSMRRIRWWSVGMRRIVRSALGRALRPFRWGRTCPTTAQDFLAGLAAGRSLRRLRHQLKKIHEPDKSLLKQHCAAIPRNPA